MTSERADPVVTREAGISHVARKLAELGWTVEREGKTTRLVITKGRVRSSAQCRSVGTLSAAGLGKGHGPDAPLWWIISTNATAATPVSYILTRDEAHSLQHFEKDGSCWLEIKDYAQPAFREQWSRISPNPQDAPEE